VKIKRRIIIKVGTSTLTGGTSHLHIPQMTDLVRQMAAVVSSGERVILVSSGAIAAGKEMLNFPELPGNIPAKQMLAAVGQPHLMNLYGQLFEKHQLKIAQVLLTREDISNRQRYLNARNTLESLLSYPILPVINENDTIAVEEIRIGDNDNLSALVANLVEADLLILLTDQPGLFSMDPRQSPTAQLIHEISTEHISEELWQAAGGSANGLGTGGMLTKLQAAETARRSGTQVVIAQGSEKDVLQRIVAGERLGTWISPTTDKLESRKRYLLASANRSGSITIDEGALQALRKGGSLLPVGVRAVGGLFDQGDCVQIILGVGRQCALGLVNYSSREIGVIKGHRSSEIESLLGYTYADEIVHHNNMTFF
jgi:glutamate 5-kinase